MIFSDVNEPCENTRVTPIMVAVNSRNIEIIEELLRQNASLKFADAHGDNVFHHCAKTDDIKILQVFSINLVILSVLRFT